MLRSTQNRFFALPVSLINTNLVLIQESALKTGYCLWKLYFLFFSELNFLQFLFSHTPGAPVLLNSVLTENGQEICNYSRKRKMETVAVILAVNMFLWCLVCHFRPSLNTYQHIPYSRKASSYIMLVSVLNTPLDGCAM